MYCGATSQGDYSRSSFFFPQLYYFRIHLSDREEPIHKKKERKEEAGDDDDDEDDEGKLNSSFSRHVASEALD